MTVKLPPVVKDQVSVDRSQPTFDLDLHVEVEFEMGYYHQSVVTTEVRSLLREFLEMIEEEYTMRFIDVGEIDFTFEATPELPERFSESKGDEFNWIVTGIAHWQNVAVETRSTSPKVTDEVVVGIVGEWLRRLGQRSCTSFTARVL